MTTPGKAIVVRNKRKQRWGNTHLSNVLGERNKEIAVLRTRVAELEAEGRFSGTWSDYHEMMMRRVDALEAGYRGLREALEIAQADLDTEGCNCGDAIDPPCGLCTANNALANYPKR